MSSLSIAPDVVAEASGTLGKLGSALRSANAAAASRTTAIAAPAADEVSTAITAVFGAHAQQFQALNAKAAAFNDEFANLLSGGAAQYVSAEVANAQQMLVNAVGTGQATAATVDLTPIVNAANVAWNTFTDGVKAEAKSLGIDKAVDQFKNALGFDDTGFHFSFSTTPDSVSVNAGRTVTLDPHTLFGDGPTVTVASVQGTGTASPSGAFIKVFTDFFGLTTTVTGSVTPGGQPSFSVVPGPNPFENAFISQDQLNLPKF
jgi:hypothetical protein